MRGFGEATEGPANAKTSSTSPFAVTGVQYHADSIAPVSQALLFDLPEHRYTVLALQLIAEYKPLALVSSKLAAGPSLNGKLYITLAKRVARKLRLDSVAAVLGECLEDGRDVEQLILDTLQWCDILVAEMGVDDYTSGVNQYRERHPISSIELSLDILQSAMSLGKMQANVCFLFHRIGAYTDQMVGKPLSITCLFPSGSRKGHSSHYICASLWILGTISVQCDRLHVIDKPSE